jgi:hypothetical protein
MGGPNYEGDVAERSRSTNQEVFNYIGYDGPSTRRAVRPEERKVHRDMDPKGKIRECRDCEQQPNTTPIVFAIGTSRSRGEDAKTIYNKMPMCIGQIYLHNYITNPELCICGVGDAKFDRAPIQIGQFESDNRIDDNLAKLWLEGGGGGNGRESYELIAWYFTYIAARGGIDATIRGKKSKLFFSGDQCFYPVVKKEEVKKYFGVDIEKDIPASEIFADLNQYYDVYFIYPQKSWEERKADIDAEIRDRVMKAGGMYEGVDVRMSLMWNNHNDLDLHVIDPCGHHIYYGSYCRGNNREPASCGGFLDVDMNVHGETTKPVENIRWVKGQAPKGWYEVYVQNFATHGGHAAETPFKVEIEINGEIKHFEGKTPRGSTGSASDTPVYEFEYDPEKRKLTAEENDQYMYFRDDVVKSQWESVIPPENILILPDPSGIIDLILGVLAITNEQNGIDIIAYDEHMKQKGQTELRRKQTREALGGLAGGKSIARLDIESLPKPSGTSRKGKGRKI